MTGAKFEKLVGIMARLRGPDGCPWDRQQDRNSLKPMLVEETYEVLEAIDNNDPDGLAEELSCTRHRLSGALFLNQPPRLRPATSASQSMSAG